MTVISPNWLRLLISSNHQTTAPGACGGAVVVTTLVVPWLASRFSRLREEMLSWSACFAKLSPTHLGFSFFSFFLGLKTKYNKRLGLQMYFKIKSDDLIGLFRFNFKHGKYSYRRVGRVPRYSLLYVRILRAFMELSTFRVF